MEQSDSPVRKFRRGSAKFLWIGVLLTIFTCTFVQAQEILGTHPTGRTGGQLPLPVEEEPSAPVLKPELHLPPPPLESGKDLVPRESVFVRKIKIEGSTIFSDKDWADVIKPYLNRNLTSEDLEALRRSLTLYYVDRGYVTSGAILPDQTVRDGAITFQMIEGELADIEVEENRWVRDNYFESRLALDAGPPVNIYALQERLQLLQQDERVQRLHSELKPTEKIGESVLNVQVKETLPFSVSLGFNNYQSPTVGAERGFATVAHRSLFGWGDTLSFTYGRSSGLHPQIDAWYSIPFTPYDTTLTLHYSKNNFDVVEEPFESLGVESRSDTYGITLRHPFYRSPSQEFALALTGEHLRNETFLFGIPFSFYQGVENGESTVSVLRFSQEWLYRTQKQVIAARSRFSLGVDMLGATNNASSLPDSQFLSWLGQFQWTRVLDFRDIQAIFRADLQLAKDPLLPLEQIPVGGRFSVRGYRENELVRDNAFIASLESRIPLVQNKRWADYLHLAPFVDVGTAWNTELPTPDPKVIASVGLGLRWEATLMRRPFPIKPQFEIYWGYPLKDVETTGDDLQDEGIHFQFAIATY